MPSPTFAPVPVLRRELVQELDLNGLRLTEAWHQASSTIPRHAHRQATVTILVDGSFEEVYRFRRDLACQAPAVHIRPPGEPHLDRLGSGGAHNLVIEIDDARLASIRRHTRIFDQIRHLQDPRVIALARGIQRELTILDDASGLALEGLTLELLSTASRPAHRRAGGPPAWLRRVREVLHDRFTDPRLRLQELAVIAGVHPVHLARAFRVHYAASPGGYLRALRVQWAADEIRTTRRPLAEIAVAAGFADQSHLSRWFKRQLGTTPGAWRRLHGAPQDRS